MFASVRLLQQRGKLTDAVMGLHRMTQADLGVDFVAIPAPISDTSDHSAAFEIVQNLKDGPLRNPNGGRQIPNASRRIARQPQKHVSVVR